MGHNAGGFTRSGGLHLPIWPSFSSPLARRVFKHMIKSLRPLLLAGLMLPLGLPLCAAPL
ncbi:MAG: D-alanyl-D-alanine carboxypeptidase/D-alanyl-D-alanine-endopeptidase, partial [Proteobacteria bacterium]